MGRWAPDWDLLINGASIPAEYRALIDSIEVDATVDGADELTIRASGWSSLRNDYMLLGETLLSFGNLVVVRMGWHAPDGEVLTLQRFRMLRERATYPRDAPPSVIFRGLSAEHLLVEHTRARKFQPGDLITDIAEDLAQEHGLNTVNVSVDLATTADKGAVKAKGTTDLQYLQRLAFDNDYGPPYCRYDEALDTDGLIFERTQIGKRGGPLTFTYNPHVAGSEAPFGTCYSFEATLSLAGQPTKVEITGWDPIAQEAIQVTVEITDGGQQTTVQTGTEVGKIPETLKQGSQLQVAVLNSAQSNPATEKKESIAVATVQTTEDALAFAERWIRTRNQAFMTARAEVKGTPELWVGQIHTFDGLAPHHVGYWEVLGCRHTMDRQGYRCSLDLARVIEDDAEQPTEV